MNNIRVVKHVLVPLHGAPMGYYAHEVTVMYDTTARVAVVDPLQATAKANVYEHACALAANDLQTKQFARQEERERDAGRA